MFLQRKFSLLKGRINKNILGLYHKYFSVYNPNTLIFTHKRELEKYQKQKTRMKSPKNIEILQINEEIDFEPGLEYLGQSGLLIKVCKKSERSSKDESNMEASPEDGFIQLILPLDKDPNLRKSYRLLHYERMRYGKLLEILDYISGFSAYRFNNIVPRSKLATMVTAGVDTIELFREVNLHQPMIINAYPTWTGESSMEVRLDIYNGGENNENNQSNENKAQIQDDIQKYENDSSFLGSANFVYVMREANDYTKKKRLYNLNLHQIKEKEERDKALLRQEIGTENKKMRLRKAQQSLFKSPPTAEETKILHEQFVTYKKSKELILLQTMQGMDVNKCNVVDSRGINSMNVRTIQETKIEKSVLMHSQNINVNGHVFGGYVMREALELGYVSAYMHSNKQNASVISVDSVTFHKPVVIGSVAQFIAHVSLVQEELLHVCVEVFNYVDAQILPVLTTTINITYKTKTKTPRVVPTTYECGVKYLEAKRIIEKIFTSL